MHVKSLLADQAGWKTNHCHLFEEGVNHITVTENKTNAERFGSCQWRRIMVGWMFLNAKGQLVYVMLELFFATHSFSNYAQLRATSHFIIHHSGPVKTNYSMYSILPLCSRDVLSPVS